MPVTIKDIARVVGVSPTAVSRALNDHDDISEETRLKIKRVARELGYRRNAIARGLVRRKTDTVGLFVLGRGGSGFGDPFAYEVVLGVMDTVSALGYDLILYGVGGPAGATPSFVEKCKERRVDGVIMMGIRTDDPQYRALGELGVPCVLVDVAPPQEGIGFVSSDNVSGTKQAVAHLVELGHTRIAMLNGHAFATVSSERLEGYKIGLMNAGLPYEPELVFSGDFSHESGVRGAGYFLGMEADRRPTAVVCASDVMAIGLIQGVKERGARVPEDLSVVGFDDIPGAEHVHPPLTTVRQARYSLGATAARMVVQEVEAAAGVSGAPGEREAARGASRGTPGVRLATQLVVRKSTAPPGSASWPQS